MRSLLAEACGTTDASLRSGMQLSGQSCRIAYTGAAGWQPPRSGHTRGTRDVEVSTPVGGQRREQMLEEEGTH